jgi:hypothetical protein
MDNNIFKRNLSSQSESANADRFLKDMQLFHRASISLFQNNLLEAISTSYETKPTTEYKQQIDKYLIKEKMNSSVLNNFYKSQKSEPPVKLYYEEDLEEDTGIQQIKIPHNKKILGSYAECVETRGRKASQKIEHGRMLIDSIKLLDGILSVSYKDLAYKPQAYKKNKKNLSPEFQDVLKDLVKGGGIVDIGKLTPSDQKFILKFNKNSGIPRKTKGGTVESVSKITKRFDIVSGIIRAGNDHVDLKNELSLLINRLVDLKVLSVKDAIEASRELIADV